MTHRTAVIFGWIICFFVGIWLFGFSIGGALCTLIQLKFGARERLPLSLILSAAVLGGTYGLFELALHVPFPKGQLFLWF